MNDLLKETGNTGGTACTDRAKEDRTSKLPMKLSNKGYKIVKTVHILSASIWIGASVVGLFLLTVVMLSIVNEVGEDALSNPSFILSKNIFTGSFIVILLLLITAVCLTVIKPKLGKIKLSYPKITLLFFCSFFCKAILGQDN